ncbi:Phosphatidylinositol 4-kinase beta, partial [Perkinsus olseni]
SPGPSSEARLVTVVRESPPEVVNRWLLQIFCALANSAEGGKVLREVYQESGEEAALTLLGLAQIADHDRCATKFLESLTPVVPGGPALSCIDLVRQLGEISTHLATLPFSRRREVLEWRLRKVKLSTGFWLVADGWEDVREIDLSRSFLLNEWSSSAPFHVCLRLKDTPVGHEVPSSGLVGKSADESLYPRSILSLAPRPSRKSVVVGSEAMASGERAARRMTATAERRSAWRGEVSEPSPRAISPGRMVSLVTKAGAMPVVQERLALSMTSWAKARWLECPRGSLERSLGDAVRLYRVICTTSGGVVEAVPNAVSLDALKKAHGDSW